MVRVLEVKPLPAYRLWVRFSDGLEGEYAVEPDRRGGVFQPLRDPALFDTVQINDDFGCVEWPCGVDLCSNAMHAEIEEQITGRHAE
jgi:hypothetical protein